MSEHRYAVWHRGLTPKGNIAKKIEYHHDLNEEEMSHVVRQNISGCAWLRVEVMDVPFSGSSFFGVGPKKNPKILDPNREGLRG